MPEEQAKLAGWAIVEVMGHQTFTGQVTTEYYGGTAFFRIDVPEVPGEEIEVDGRAMHRDGLIGFTKLIGAGSVYAITPCTEEAAMEARRRSAYRPFRPIGVPAQIGAATTETDDDGEDDEF